MVRYKAALANALLAPTIGGECVEWTGTCDYLGYGRLYASAARSTLAHRAIWELANGPLLPDQVVCHRCDNPPCVRLDHLFVGTQIDNIRDRDSKGRAASGDRSGPRRHPEIYKAAVRRGKAHPGAKLDEVGVKTIRALREQGWSQSKIAKHVGVSQQLISNVLLGLHWTHT